MEAKNETIENWLIDIRRGALQLPRFQRGEAWDHNLVKNFLDAVIAHDRPLGILLTLEVDTNNQPFATRPLEGADNDKKDCRAHLLDGQQRLTALWKALNDKYEDRRYFIKFSFNGSRYICESIESFTRKNNPWSENLSELIAKNLIPFSLLYPEDALDKIDTLFDHINGHDRETIRGIRKLATDLWMRLSSKSIPYWSLPQSTSADDAIDIFISTNTNYTRLKPFDIAVAQFEADTQESLQAMVDQIADEVPSIVDLEGENNLGDLVLKVACLFQGKTPTFGNYKSLDMKRLKDEFIQIQDGIKWTTELMDKEKIWKQEQLPTSVPLRVLPALFQFMPKFGDNRAKADRLILRYIWLSFFTNRYDVQANSKLKSDFDELKNVIQKETYKSSALKTVFSEQLPTTEDLKVEGWPKSRGIRKRAILAICNKQGANDIASNVQIAKDYERQYHHIFPKGLFEQLKEGECNPNLALNCMLIEGHSNKQWNKRWPGDYIVERIENSGLKGNEAKEELRVRLESHLLPSGIIIDAVAGNNKSLSNIYNDFLERRARMILERLKYYVKPD